MTDLLRFKLIGSSERFQAALTHLRKVAGVDATVLIQGETGTGIPSTPSATCAWASPPATVV